MKQHSIPTRPIVRAKRPSRPRSTSHVAQAEAIQIFISKLDAFVGTEMFDAALPITIGRHHSALIRLESDTISRCHCQLVLEDGVLAVEDLGSANGTYVNRERVTSRTAVKPTDVIHIGPFGIKVRVVNGPGYCPADATDDEPTRVEAILSVDESRGSGEAFVDVDEGFDHKLYEEAIRRTTGRESPRRIEQSAPRPPDATDHDHDSKTFEDDSTMHAADSVSEDVDQERVTPLRAKVDPKVEARLRDLDELIAALDAKQRDKAPESPWVYSEIESVELTDGELSEASVEHYLSSSRAMNTQEFARDLASRLAVDGSVIGASSNVIPLTRRSSTKNDKGSGPITPPPETSKDAQKPAPVVDLHRELPLPQRAARRRVHQARLMTPTSMRPGVQGQSGPASAQVSPVDPFDDVWTQPRGPAQPPPLPKKRAEAKPPKPPSPPPVRAAQRVLSAVPTLSGSEDATLAETEPAEDIRFDGVEIAARAGGQLLDIAVLRREGEQYVLGHRTPQGTMAPAETHVGLRLLRINPDRTVDLVFPKDVAGHLVRGSVTKMFNELTEDRKYSCLRMEPRDVATVILGEGRKAVSYHIHFLRRPRSLFRALRRG